MCEFKQKWDKSEGKASDCEQKGGSVLAGSGSGYTLEQCKIATQENNGNVLNWKEDGQCYFKWCKDIMDLKPTTSHGGWDVYALECPG